MNTENKEAKVKNRQIWGWSLAIGGGLFTLSGIYYLVITLFGESTNWHVGILDTVPGLLLGIPLLILGIRWIKNRGGNEIINSENIAKNKKHLIWGWIAAIVGGLFTLVGIDSMFYSIFGENPYWYVGIWICTVPGLLLGVPLLIIGIRWIKAVNASQTMNSVNLAVRVKRRRIWGWILALIGGLVVLISIGLLSFISYVMFILSHLKGIVEPYEGYNAVTVIYSFSLFILPLLLIGLSLIILGYIMLRKKVSFTP
jgi:dipeptide/tripeptide permease